MTAVGSEDFLTRDEAADRLAKMSVGWLIVSGILDNALLNDGTEGVTLRSVEHELAWQDRATRWMKVRRTIGGLLRLPDLV